MTSYLGIAAVSGPFGFVWRKDFSKTLFEYCGAKLIIISGPNPLNYESYTKIVPGIKNLGDFRDFLPKSKITLNSNSHIFSSFRS